MVSHSPLAASNALTFLPDGLPSGPRADCDNLRSAISGGLGLPQNGSGPQHAKGSLSGAPLDTTDKVRTAEQ